MLKNLFTKIFLLALLFFPAVSQAAATEITVASSNFVEIQEKFYAGSLGSSIASGDLNGDGNIDVIIGAKHYAHEDTGYDTGAIYILYGDGSRTTTQQIDSSAVIITGENNGDQFGSEVAVGDINGDGYDDILVGALSYNTTSAIYVIYGGASEHTSGTTTGVLFELESTTASAGLDGSIQSGDLDGDGYDDIIVGVHSDDGFATNAGAVYIIYGNSSQLASARLEDQIIFQGEAASDNLGYSVAVGNINGDSYADIIVGAHNNDDFATNAGAAYVIVGSNSQHSSANISTALQFSGTAAGDRAGLSVEVGDINGDSIDDILVGAYRNSDGGASAAGAVHILYGSGDELTQANLSTFPKLTGFSVNAFAGSNMYISDVNGDTYGDILIASSVAEQLYIVLGGSSELTSDSLSNADITITDDDEDTNATFFSSPIYATDIDNDGKSDIFMIDDEAEKNGYLSGGTYITYGSSSLADMNLTDSDTLLTTGYSFEQFIEKETVFADLNGDGYDELVLLSQQSGASSGNPNSSISIVYGTRDDLGNPYDITDAVTFRTSSEVSYEFQNLAAGDINNDGYDDVLFVSSRESYVLYGRSTEFEDMEISSSTAVLIDNFSTGGGVSGVVEDINGDSYADIIVYDNDNIDIFYGQADEFSSLDADSADATITIETAATNNMVEVGDINGDGFNDLIVTRYQSDSSAGAFYVLYSSASQFTDQDITTNGIKIAGESADDNLARYFSLTVGDVNADGYEDIIAGAYQNDEEDIDAGAMYVVYGQSSALSAGSISDHVRITGTTASENFGRRRATIMDFDSDGVNDIIVSSDTYNSNAGVIIIFFGEADTQLTNGTWLAKANLYFDGENGAGGNLAHGDFDGDGYNDLFYLEVNAGAYGNGQFLYVRPANFSLTGSSSVSVECKATYTDAGATATDYFSEASLAVTTSNPVNTNVPATYTVTYTAEENSYGVAGTGTRTVEVTDTADPTISLTGESTITLTVGDTYTEEGATATDTCDSSVSVTMSGSVDTDTAGTYAITYIATDDSGNTDTTTRSVTVEAAEDTSTGDDSTAEEEETSLTVTGVTPLTNSRVRVTYSDGTTRTIRAFARGSQKPRVKLTSDGERVVVLKRNGKNVRVFDAFTGERLRGKKVRNAAQSRAYLKLVQKNGKEYVVVVTKRLHTIRTTLMRLTPATDKLLNTNTKQMTYLKANFRVQIRNSRVVIKKRNGTVKRVYKITRRHKLKKHQ